MENETVENLYEWDVIDRKPTFWKATLKRMIVLLPLAAAVSYGLYKFSFDQKYIKADELFIFFEICLVFVLLVINFIAHRIMLAMPETLVHFKVSADGVERNNKKIPLSSVVKSGLAEIFATPALEFALPTTQGKIILRFASEQGKKNCLETLQKLTS